MLVHSHTQGGHGLQSEAIHIMLCYVSYVKHVHTPVADIAVQFLQGSVDLGGGGPAPAVADSLARILAAAARAVTTIALPVAHVAVATITTAPIATITTDPVAAAAVNHKGLNAEGRGADV